MNGVQQVGFTHAIISNKTVDFFGKTAFEFGVILKIDQR